MGFDWVALIVGVIGAVTGLIGAGINNYQQDKVNKENKDYATEMTNAQWERDDTSLERQVKDAKAAGLSPLAVTGAMNTSSPLNYVAQAPQMDLSSLVGLASSAMGNMTTRAEGKENRFATSENLKKELDNSLKELEMKFKNDKELQDDQQIEDSINLGKTLSYQYSVLNEQVWEKQQDIEIDRIKTAQEKNLEIYNSLCQSIGFAPKTKEVDNYEDYIHLYDNFMVKYNQYLNDLKHIDGPRITSQGNSESLDSKALGQGIGFSTSENASMDNNRDLLHQAYSEYLSNAVFPILTFDSDTRLESPSYNYE